MFTGIIQSVGVVKSLDGENLIISPNSDKFINHELGTSIAVEGNRGDRKRSLVISGSEHAVRAAELKIKHVQK